MKINFNTLKKYQTENGCYKAAKPIGKVKGIIISCTEDNEPHLMRYVDAHNELGFNEERNHWNNPQNKEMPHEFIGYDKSNKITIVNTLPYSYSSFACGKGINGSYDISPNGHLQVCICKNDLEDTKYFNEAVSNAAVQVCAKLCKKHNLKCMKVISDKEVFELGYAENYSVFEEWLRKNGRSMDDLRLAIKNRLNGK